ncbi:HAMP domain-containing sensor histidine kinase [Brevibacterium sp. K11IcPPYGO002]|uniref:sensor histidine kinase n=1 Tax=Brevibacterium sp. K11IcPPYGO002 TaxID=3058837 RepID=UPI003D815585
MRLFGRPTDPDARLINATARRVALWITAAATALALIAALGALWVVFSRIPPGDLIQSGDQERTLTISGLDILENGLIIAIGAVILAGVLALLITRRAVAPLVDALARQRRFVADASHELRTPLTVLDTRIQLLQRSVGPDSAQAETVAKLRSDSRTLITIVNDLLESVEVTPTAEAAPTSVPESIDSVVATMRLSAENRHVSLDIAEDAASAAALARNPDAPGTSADPLTVAMPAASLNRCLLSLIDNALKHSPEKSTVRISTAADKRRISISVRDEGPGISGISSDRVFDRFARSSDARDGGGTSRTGFGIGLSLVQESVNRWGGTVEVAATSARGTTMTLNLPRPRSRHLRTRRQRRSR